MDLSNLLKNVIIVGDLYWFQCKRAENFFIKMGRVFKYWEVKEAPGEGAESSCHQANI
jgi:hypothetical protein